ncbi:MAG: Integral rane sensor signal transduction histidine kinase [Verrucomicrobiales bacterium]|nr:Integral rane sensor signal transduction histidine kinase [Verrucomicrobiales bacterium]
MRNCPFLQLGNFSSRVLFEKQGWFRRLRYERNKWNNAIARPLRGLFRNTFVIVKRVFQFIAFLFLLAITTCGLQGATNSTLSPPASSKLNFDGGGLWIWADKTTDRQSCRFWKTVKIPRDGFVVEAHLRMTADNSYAVYLDGRKLGQGSEWRTLTDYDLTWVLSPGIHVIAVEAFNEYSDAGLLADLAVDLKDGTSLRIVSDQSWRIVPEDETDWHTRKQPRPTWSTPAVIGMFGVAPWKQLGRTIRVPIRPVYLEFWQTGWFQISSTCIMVIIGIFCLKLMAQLAVQRKAEEVLKAERTRVAQDFHDDLGARLTQVVLLGEVAQRELPPGTVTRAKIDQICERVRDLSGAVNEIIWTVNSQCDTLPDFAGYVCKYAETFLRDSTIRCRFDIGLELPDVTFDLPTRRNLFLAVKEALNNAAKHSQANELFLRIHCENDVLKVVVEDNGKGFDGSRQDPERNGLKNMAQRMTRLGGEFRASGEPGQGSRIEFEVPLVQRRRRYFWLER